MNLRDILALPFLVLHMLLLAIAVTIGGRWTAKLVANSSGELAPAWEEVKRLRLRNAYLERFHTFEAEHERKDAAKKWSQELQKYLEDSFTKPPKP